MMFTCTYPCYGNIAHAILLHVLIGSYCVFYVYVREDCQLNELPAEVSSIYMWLTVSAKSVMLKDRN